MLTRTVAGRPSSENKPGWPTQRGRRQDRKPPLPRNLELITGASGSTDIEGSYVRGAHGLRHLPIVLVEG